MIGRALAGQGRVETAVDCGTDPNRARRRRSSRGRHPGLWRRGPGSRGPCCASGRASAPVSSSITDCR